MFEKEEKPMDDVLDVLQLKEFIVSESPLSLARARVLTRRENYRLHCYDIRELNSFPFVEVTV